MADQRKEIKFHKSMTADKRNENFAYLRKQVADVSTNGLYPSRDYTEFTTMPTISSGSIAGLFGLQGIFSQTKPYFNLSWVHDKSDGSSYSYDFYVYGDMAPFHSFTSQITGFADNGRELYYTTGNKIRKAGTAADIVSSYSGASVDTAGAWDGLYVWFIEEGNSIWKYLPGENTINEAFVDNPFKGIVTVDFYKDQMAVFCNNSNIGSTEIGFDGYNYVYLWDKSNSSFLQKRLPVKGYILAGGVINEELYVVYSLSNTGNPKEEVGDIVVAQYNGEKFIEVNRIKTGKRFTSIYRNFDVEYLSGNLCSKGDNFILFSVVSNENTKDEIYRNYIYKISAGGYISVEAGPVDESTLSAYPVNIKSFRNFNTYVYNNKIYTNEETDETNTEYTNYTKTTYITNFYCNPYNTHTLTALSLSFEKLFNAEELDIYYRTSDKESFVLLANITRQNVKDYVNKRIDQSTADPTPSQRYQITKMPDGTALPEFNEIQFKFVSKKGFSIIGSWFEYDYITRNTKK